MSGILHRTVFYERDSAGRIRPWDFAVVQTQVGVMVEPRIQWFPRYGVSSKLNLSFDPTDDISRIDEMKEFSLDKNQNLIGAGLHGGNLWPRTGR